MKKFLDCHTTGRMTDNDEVFAIEGKSYEVIEESEVDYVINSEIGTHYFEKDSCAKWFKVTFIPTKNKKIENMFSYHPPKSGQPFKYTAIREKAKELAYLIEELCPESSDKEMAITHLRQATFWANASIAINE